MIRVLLVEDDPVIRDTTCYFLKSQQNFEVVCAETGGDALSHAREKFDVILMDILLPDTNGVDLCQRLRSWHHCPIIFTSLSGRYRHHRPRAGNGRRRLSGKAL